MEVHDLPNPEAPNLGAASGDTGAGLNTEQPTPTPGSPEYMGHMAKRGGATDEEVAMIVGAAQKSDPNYKPTEGNTDDDQTGEGDGNTANGEGGSDGSGEGNQDQDGNNEGEGDDPGVTLEGLQQEVTDNGGKLTDDTLSKLEGLGFKRGDIEKYVDEQYKIASGEAARVTAEVYSEVGGKERYVEMIGWAGDNMTLKDVKALNADLSSGDMTKMKDAMGRLNKRYTAKNGNPPRKIQRGSNRSTTKTVDVYRSQSELTAAMNDPKYKKDPAYRNDVAQKLGRSPSFRMS